MLSAVSHMMLRYPPFRMVAGVYAHTIGDRAVFAHFGINDLYIPGGIAIVAKGRFNKPGIWAKRCPGADGAVLNPAGWMYIGFLSQQVFLFIFGNRRKVFKILHLKKL
jgi:hypothetical protein